MKAILKIDEIVKDIERLLVKSTSNIYKEDDSFTPKIEELYKNLNLSKQKVAYEIYEILRIDRKSNIISADLDVLINDFNQANDLKSLFDYKKKLINDIDILIKSNPNCKELKELYFDCENAFFNSLKLVDVFIKMIPKNEWLKFEYFVCNISNRDDTFKVDENTFVYINDLFKDTYDLFFKIIFKKIELLYVEYIIKQINDQNQVEDKDYKGDLSLFGPESEFAKIFYDKEKIPINFYEYIKEKSTHDLHKPFFSRLNFIFKEKLKYKNKYLISKKTSAEAYNKPITLFLGEKYTYSEKHLSNVKIDELKKELHEYFTNKNLNIRLL